MHDSQTKQTPLPHNGQNNHQQRRSSKVPVRELPRETMPKHQHNIYPQLYCVEQPAQTTYQWDCVILDLDRTIIHGKRLSVKRWRKYVENGTIPSLAENQCSKWHRHIHRKGHQMHPFIRGRTMIYYRPFTWHLLAVLDYLKSHFGTKIIVCTKAGEHYAASVLAALISNFTSANPDLIDDVYNFHDLHDDVEEEGKPKKPFRLICNRHNLDPKKTLIVDDNATSWFAADRMTTNFWMPPCYGYQIHEIDNELQLLCKYLWDPIQKHHLEKKMTTAAVEASTKKESEQATKRYQEQEEGVTTTAASSRVPLKCNVNVNIKALPQHHQGQHSQVSNVSNCTDSMLSSAASVSSPQSTPKREIVLQQSPKSVSSTAFSPKQRYLQSPVSHNNGNSPKNLHELHSYPQCYPSNPSLEYHQSLSSAYSMTSCSAADSAVDVEPGMNHLSSHNKQNAVNKQQFHDLLDGAGGQYFDCEDEQKHYVAVSRVPRSYNVRKFKEQQQQLQQQQQQMQMQMAVHDGYGRTHVHTDSGLMIMNVREPALTSNYSSSSAKSASTATSTSLSSSASSSSSRRSPKAQPTKTKKKGYFFESKSRGSKKLAKLIGK